jgi:hypothetical protein
MLKRKIHICNTNETQNLHAEVHKILAKALEQDQMETQHVKKPIPST